MVSFRILAQSHFWNWILVGGVFASLLFFLGFTLTYHGITVSPTIASLFYEQAIDASLTYPMPMSLEMYWIIFYLLKSPAVWLTTALALVLCLLPYLIVQVLKNSGLFVRIQKYGNHGHRDSKVEFDNYGFDDAGSIVNIRL